MTRDEWIAAFAEDAGVKRPSPEEIRQLLDLAAVAAHSSERTAAPLTCWIAGRSDRPASELVEVAKRISEAP